MNQLSYAYGASLNTRDGFPRPLLDPLPLFEIFSRRDHPSAWNTSVTPLEASWTLETDSHIHYLTLYCDMVLSYQRVIATSSRNVVDLYIVENRWQYKAISSEGPQSVCGNSPSIQHMLSHSTRVRMASYSICIPVKADPLDKGKRMYSGLHWKLAMTPYKVQSFRLLLPQKVGMYDGTIAIYNVRNRNDMPALDS